MEAEEVLDGGGCVEDVTFSRHHQHEAVQRLQTIEKITQFFLIYILIFHPYLVTLYLTSLYVSCVINI